MNLNEIRSQIDDIDDEITDLLKKRYSLARKVGEIKKNSSQGVFIPERENAIIERLIQKADGNLSPMAIKAIYREVFSGSRFIENPITVHFLLQDTSAVIAAYSILGSSIILKPHTELNSIFASLKKDVNSYAVLASDISVPASMSAEIITETEDIYGKNSELKYRFYSVKTEIPADGNRQ